MSLKNKFDFKSIKFKLWFHFILFAFILIFLIWSLQIFFLKNYYEEMKIKETTKIANRIIDEYRRGDVNISELAGNMQELSTSNDIYVKIETGNGAIIAAPDSENPGAIYMYNRQVNMLRDRLKSSTLDRVSIITPQANNSRTLSYACYLYRSTGGHSEVENLYNSHILYIFSPLYPVESTVSILRAQLIYITIIALLLALAIALYLSNRISKPIKNITSSAAEMGKGNYGVTFKGGHYTEISELADTLTSASHELEKTDIYHKDLIANVSHDLKTPLTMIKSYAEMIRDLSGDNPEKRVSHLNVIIEEADRLNQLVNDMMVMSKMQSKQIELERVDFDIAQTAQSLLASYEILAEQEGYKFYFTCHGPLMVNGDEAKIHQVLSNLINNAVKYCGNDKEIIIKLKRIGRKVHVEVTDHGPGIAPDEINHVWERYYKSSTHHVRPTEGSGLGLSIVKEILILHKAEFGVNSKLGKGSTFWFDMNAVSTKKPHKKTGIFN